MFAHNTNYKYFMTPMTYVGVVMHSVVLSRFVSFGDVNVYWQD